MELLAEARDATGLAVVTEVMAKEQVELVAKYADVLQVGARNMQNYPLLEAVGESGLPVLLKRGPAATMDEFLLAAEYILKTGNQQVILCERGIRTFEDHTRFTLPLATVPYLHEKTHLPVMVDPSHGTGKASLVATMARAAVAAGADGLIVEIHPHPEKALSDGYQALTPPAFRQMMRECRKVAEAVGLTGASRKRERRDPNRRSRFRLGRPRNTRSAAPQVVGVGRLDEVVIEARFLAPPPVVVRAVAGEGRCGPLQARYPPDAQGHLVAVEAGQADVGQPHVRPPGLGLAHAVRSRWATRNRVRTFPAPSAG